MVHEADHTIRGQGVILGGTGGMINRGRIIGDVTSRILGITANALGFTNDTTGTVQAEVGSTVSIGGTFTNFSGTTLTGGNYVAKGTIKFDNADVQTNAAVLTLDGIASEITDQSNLDGLRNFNTNTAAGSFTILNGRNFTSSLSLANEGSITVGTNSQMTVNGSYAQTGGTTVVDGSLIADTIKIDGGIFAGSGNTQGQTTFGPNSIVDPGSSPGIANFFGDTVFDGVIKIEIAGILVDSGVPEPANINTATDPLLTEFDQINIFDNPGTTVSDGTAALADSLNFNITLIDGFLPSAGDLFDILTADTLLANLNLINFATPNGFSVSLVNFFDQTVGSQREALRLVFVGTATAVPEPATLIIFIFGLAALWQVRQKTTA